MTKRSGIAVILAIVLSIAATELRADVIIDNGAAGTSSTGTWQISGAAGAYGTNSLWSYRGATYTWSFTPDTSGVYNVSMWWTALSSRYASVPVIISHSGGLANLTVDQRTGGGQWNSLGDYEFIAGTTYSVSLTAVPSSSPPSTSADAVKFTYVPPSNAAPTAVIDSIVPNAANVGEVITFTGHGADSDGTIAAYLWKVDDVNQSIDPNFVTSELAEGLHTVSFAVQDDDGAWSAPVTQTVSVVAPVADIIIDNGQTGTSSTGTWQVSGAFGAYGTNSLWSYRGATYTWSFTPSQSGIYDVSMWWTALSSRYASVPVNITYSGGTANLTVDQRVNGGQWNSLGEYEFTAGTTYSVSLTAVPSSSPPSTSADAVRFKLVSSTNAAPTAVIDSISPSNAHAGDSITFSGHGVDTDGYITAQQWESNIDGVLSTESTFAKALSLGNHTISFKVMDDKGAWSTAVTGNVSVTPLVPDVIIDNGTTGTSYTGVWQVSAAPNPYGTDSLWSRDGATYTWQMSSKPSGTYEVFMWWTQLSTRTSSAAIGITDTVGVSNVTVNQRSNGGKWNSLGFYKFGSTGRVTLTASDSETSSTCADAVLFRLVAPNAVPIATIDSISPAGVTIGQAVNFAGHGSDSDGVVAAQQWESNIDGVLSSANTFTRVLSQGTHIISFKVMDDQGFWSMAATRTLSVIDDANEFIIDNSDTASTSRTGTWSISSGAGSYGADSLWSRNGTTFSWYFTPPKTGSYDLAMWWTAMASRPTAAAVDIYDADGTHRITLNQKTNGAMWNTVARCRFRADTRYQVKITAANGSSVSTCADAIKFTWFLPVEKVEHIYVCQIYSWNELFLTETADMLQQIGATRQSSSLYTYRDDFKMTTYYIHMVTTRYGMEQALKEEGSHVIVGGHSNFGMGPAFATDIEFAGQEIDNLYYVDDDHFLNISSPMTSLKIDGMKYGQAFPNWRPIYKDGTSALMPYTFDEGLPPYNYYTTYKLAGDPNAYKVELSNGSNLERFPDSGVPAWYSPTGAPPDPNVNPEYFIINDDPDFVRCDFVGTWSFTKIGSGYMGEEGYFGYNYQYRTAGTGANTATYNMFVPWAGSYRVSASWPADPTNATNAPYTIRHRDGVSSVIANQQVIAGDWNVLGTYNFNRGSYGITLSDNANGRVIADAMLMEPMDNPNNLLQAEFTTSVRSGLAPLAVQFTDRSIALKGTKTRLWNFGDGTTSVDQKPVHLYTTSGLYTVTLQITDATGAQDTETKTNVIAVGTAAPLTAAFTSSKRNGSGRTAIRFTDYSTGNITSRLWSFGDGKTSTDANPLHTYSNIGAYTVSLTVSGPGGSRTETETNYVYILKPNVYADNTSHDKTHFMTGTSRPFGKVVMDTRVSKIRTADLKYKRLFYGSCNSASYFLDVLQHGLVFCTDGDTYHYAGVTYLEDYLKGYNDADILTDINKIDPVFERIDFTKKPPSLR